MKNNAPKKRKARPGGGEPRKLTDRENALIARSWQKMKAAIEAEGRAGRSKQSGASAKSRVKQVESEVRLTACDRGILV